MNQYEQDQENARINRKVFLATHPEYHLYRDLQESLPKFNRQVSKIEKVDWESLAPLNHRGLPF